MKYDIKVSYTETNATIKYKYASTKSSIIHVINKDAHILWISGKYGPAYRPIRLTIYPVCNPLSPVYNPVLYKVLDKGLQGQLLCCTCFVSLVKVGK